MKCLSGRHCAQFISHIIQRERIMSGTRSVTFDVRRVRGQNRALSHKRPNRSCARVGICLVAHRGIFLAVCTRDFPRIHHAQMHTHCRPRRRFSARNSEPVGSADRQKFNRWPPALQNNLSSLFCLFFLSFFLSLSPCKTTMQNKITGS